MYEIGWSVHAPVDPLKGATSSLGGSVGSAKAMFLRGEVGKKNRTGNDGRERE